MNKDQYEERFMQLALALSAQALHTPGTEPFGAVVVKDGQVVGQGFNHSVADFDPTSHGEVVAIRDACRRLQTVNLAGCHVYTSCEPCAMCVAAMHIAGISRLFYAASLAQSGQVFEGLPVSQRHPIDVDVLRHACSLDIAHSAIPAEQHQAPAALDILCRWAEPRKLSA